MIETFAVGFFGGMLGAAAARWMASAIAQLRYRRTVRRRMDELAVEDLGGRRLW